MIKDNTNFKSMDLNDLWLVGDVLFVEVIHLKCLDFFKFLMSNFYVFFFKEKSQFNHPKMGRGYFSTN